LITFGFGVSSAFAGAFGGGLTAPVDFGFVAAGSVAPFFSLSEALADFSGATDGVLTGGSAVLT